MGFVFRTRDQAIAVTRESAGRMGAIPEVKEGLALRERSSKSSSDRSGAGLCVDLPFVGLVIGESPSGARFSEFADHAPGFVDKGGEVPVQ